MKKKKFVCGFDRIVFAETGCPTCKAVRGEPCVRLRNGKEREPHKARLEAWSNQPEPIVFDGLDHEGYELRPWE